MGIGTSIAKAAGKVVETAVKIATLPITLIEKALGLDDKEKGGQGQGGGGVSIGADAVREMGEQVRQFAKEGGTIKFSEKGVSFSGKRGHQSVGGESIQVFSASKVDAQSVARTSGGQEKSGHAI